ncbi:tandem-95 repeat protein [Polaromonas sp. A23]|uniref:tandem-95 repeat protein n=1 Tax=Polaromonas sp. A23 TaxID=1944133 RepID=UPI0009846D1A|nr:tandem-95 repeat protein [Polaromonas sp. A23]
MANEAKVVGNVVLIEGVAFAQNAEGEQRQLRFGDPVFEGEVIVTTAGGRVELAFDQGGKFLLRSRETVTLDSTVFDNLLPDGNSGALLTRVGELTTILNAINEGSSLDRLLQETSAGVNSTSDGRATAFRPDDGNNFVRLFRTAEQLAPLSYEYASLDRRSVGDEIIARISPEESLVAPVLTPTPGVISQPVVEAAPVIAGVFVGTVAEDGTQVASQPVSFANVASTAGGNGYGSFVLSGGTWTYTLNNAAVQFLDVGQSTTDTITYTATNGSTQTITVTINGAEDAAVIGGVFVGTVAEDGAATASGALSISDVDTNDQPVSFANVASTAGGNGYGSFVLSGGTWTYTLNNAAVQFLDVGQSTTDTITYTATNGSTQTITVTINGAEDAAVLANTALTLTSVNEDAATPSGAVGSLISTLLGGSTDADGSAIQGIAITAADATNGTWYYSTNGGTNWIAVGAVGNASSLLLASNANTRIYFQPNANYTGTVTTGLTIRAWDQTSGTAGTKVDTSTNGGTTAFSNATDTVAITVDPVNDAPVNTVPGAQTTSEEVTQAITGLSISDAIDGNSGTMTVTLAVANGMLTVSGGTATITNSGTGTVTLTGTVAQINATLAATVNYVPTADFYGTETLTMTTNDGGNVGGGALTDVDTVSITVSPTVDIANDTATTAEDTPITISVLTNDSFENAGRTITSVGGLAITAGGSAVAVANGTVSLNTSGQLIFTPAADYVGLASFTYTVTSGGAVETATVDVTVTAVNDAPVNVVAGSISITEDVPTAITGISVSDVDVAAGVITVTLSVPAGTFTATTSGGVTVAGSGSNTLTLTGSQTDINSFIAGSGVIYTTAANANGSVVMTMTTNDGGNTGTGGALSDTDVITLNITPVNDTPVNTVTVAQTTDEDTNKAITGLTISDAADGNVGSMTVTLAVANGTLTVTGGTASIANSGTGTVTLIGTVAQINATLASNVTYVPNANYNGADTLTMTTNDNGNVGGGALTDVDTVGITVVAINDAPVNTVPVSIAGTEDVATVITGISIGDVDASSSTMNVTLSAPTGTLAAISSGGVTVTGSGTGSLVLAGTQANINAFIAASNVTYLTASNVNGSVVLTVTTSDLGNTGTGGTLTDVDTVTLDIAAVNDAPTLTATASNPTFTEGAGSTQAAAVSVFSGATVSAVEATQSVTGLTFTVSGLLNGANEQIVVDGTTITLGADTSGTTTTNGMTYSVTIVSGTATVVLSGGTLANAATQTLVNGITYQNTSIDNPSDGNRVFTLTQITDDGGTANGGVNTTALSIASTVNVNPVNDAPVVDLDGSASGTGYATTFFDNVSNPIAIADADILITDLDHSTLTGATITIGTGRQGTDVLTFTNTASITGSAYNSTTGVLTLSGTDTLANYMTAIRSMRFDSTSTNNSTRTVSVVVTDGVTASTAANTTITINGSTSAPVAVAASATGNEDDPAGIPITLNASDPNGTINNFRVTVLPANGTLYTDAAMTQAVVLNANIAVTPLATQSLTLYFKPNANYNGAPTFSYRALDNAGNLSTTVTGTITVTAVNDAPVNTVTAAFAGTEDTNRAITGLSISDAADGNTGTITVTLTVTNGTITVAGSGATITNNNTSTVTLTGTVANINTRLSAVTYVPTADFNGAAVLTMTTDDGGNVGGGALTDVDTVTITLAAVADITNDAVTTTEDTPLSFNVITGTSGATADTFENAGRVVTAVTQGANGTVGFTAAGVLTYTPNANYSGNDSFTYTVTSGGVTETATVNVTVSAINDAPVNSTPASITVTEDVASVITGISISDADASGSTMTVTFGVPAGTLSAVSAGGVTVAGSGTGSLVLTGTQANINSFIAASAVTYTTAANANGTVTLAVTTSDLGNTGAGGTLTDVDTITLNITAVNDAPILDLDGSVAGTGYVAAYTENGTGVQITDSDMTLSDDATNLASATVTLTNWQAGDVLAIGSIPAGITYTLSGPNNNILTLSGAATVADYQVALRAITYSSTSENPNTTPRTITVVVNDGLVDSGTATTTVNVTAINDAPVLDLDGNAAGTDFSNYFIRSVGPAPTPVRIADLDDVISDADNANLTGATITLTNWQTSDVLAVGGLPSGITAVISGANNNIVTLSGSASVANYQTALQAITFTNASTTASLTARSFTVTVTDGVTVSNTANATVNVATSGDPIAAVASSTGNEDAVGGIPITLSAVDPNGTVSTFTLSSVPANGTLYTDAGMTQAVATSTAYAASGGSLTLYFQPTTHWAGSTTFNFFATDNSSANSTSTVATVNVTAVADTPSLTVNNSLTQVFNTSWESVGALTATSDDTNNATHAMGTAAIEGWSLTTPAVADTVGTSGGTQVSQFYFNADGDQILNSNSATLYTAAGMLGSTTGGDAQRVFLHLDNAVNGVSALNPNYQTPAITRTINVTDINHVYQLSLNYAPDAAPTANTGFQVLVDGVVVGTYTASAANSSLVWQAVRSGFSFATTGSHTITIQTTSPESGNGVGGYFDDIRLVEAQGAMQDNYLSANYGTVTRISLAGQVTAGLVDTDGSETLSLVITNMPGGSRIVSGATTYSPISGQVTIPYSALAAAYLMFPEDYSGRVDLGVTATSTESLNGATATNSQTLTFHIFQQGMSAGDPPLMAVVNDTTIVEGDYAMFDIRLGAQTANDVTVTLETTNGTATGADYGAGLQYSVNGGTTWANYTGAMVISSGKTSVLVRTTTTADGSIEGSETFTLTATVSSGPVINSVAVGTATILDLDSAPILQVRPVGQWTFDEGFGVPALNEYRNIIGTLADANTTNGNATPTWITGHATTSNTALQFDGKGASLSVDPAELDPITNSATVTFWIKTTQNATTDAAQFGGTDIGWNRPSVIGSEQNSAVNDAQWGWIDNTGHIALNVGNTAGAKSTTVISDDTWHFVAMTRNSTTGETQIWVDGVLENTVTATGLQGTITNVFGIGFTNGVNNDFSRNIANDKYLNAGVDDLRIYSNVLTNEQVRSIWETETNHHDVGIANDGGSFQFDVTARAFDTLTVSGLQSGWVVSDDSGHTATSTGITQFIDISTWSFDSPLTVTGITTAQSAMIDISATKGVHTVDQFLSLVSITNAYEGTGGNNTPTLTANSDFAFGNAGIDTLTGGAGDDRLEGGAGSDIISGGADRDLVIGGQDADTLTGGAGADIFAWELNDGGTAGAPVTDTVTDFDLATRAAGGDVLDLRDLLVGETAGSLLGQDNLANFLHFEKSGADTIVHISTTGGFASDPHTVGAPSGVVTGAEDQRIVLSGIDMIGAYTTDQQVIQDLLTKGKLNTD